MARPCPQPHEDRTPQRAEGAVEIRKSGNQEHLSSLRDKAALRAFQLPTLAQGQSQLCEVRAASGQELLALGPLTGLCSSVW